MKSLIRSLMWQDSKEKDLCTANIQYLVPERLLSLGNTEKLIINYIQDFYLTFSESPSYHIVYDYYEKASHPEAVTYLEDAVSSPLLSSGSFKSKFETLVEESATTKLIEVLKHSAKIATSGVVTNGTLFKGVDAAISHLFSTVEPTPRSHDLKLNHDLSLALDGVKSLVSSRRSNPSQTYGIMTGYGLIDNSTGGIRKSQLYLHAGFVGALKCVSSHSRVLTQGGTYPHISHIPTLSCLGGGFYNSRGSVSVGSHSLPINKKYVGGVQPVYRVTSSLGYTLLCTKEHRLSSLSSTTLGWKKVSSLVVGDTIQLGSYSPSTKECNSLLPDPISNKISLILDSSSYNLASSLISFNLLNPRTPIELHHWIFNSSFEVRLSYLKGLLEGFLSSSPLFQGYLLVYQESFSSDIQILSNSLGIFSLRKRESFLEVDSYSLQFRPYDVRKYTSFIPSISKFTSSSPSNNLPFLPPPSSVSPELLQDLVLNLKDLLSSSSLSTLFFDSSFCLDTVVSITEEPPIEVEDLEVEDHSYIVQGFVSHNSTMMLNMVVNAAVDGGYNPLLFSSEMPQDAMMLMLASIHSGNPKFNQVHSPLNAHKLILGALDSDEESFFHDVLDDLVQNPTHGKIRVVDSSEFTTFGSIMQRTVRAHADYEVDMLWVDYITRLPVDLKYYKMSLTDARNETLADAKRFAMSFDNGRGLPVCSPFQVNREGYKKGKEEGGKLSKCQPLHTPILSPTGWVELGSIKEGDFVMGADGLPTKVLGVFRPGIKVVYRFTFRDGATTLACLDHIWLVRDLGFVSNQYLLKTTKHLLSQGVSRKGGTESKFCIPLPSPINFQEKSFFIHPYLLGVLLGDGCFSTSTPNLCDGISDLVISKIPPFLPEGVCLVRQSTGDVCPTFFLVDKEEVSHLKSVNRLEVELKRLGLKDTKFWSKFIPEEYLLGSVEQRLKLLQGLMDTGGCLSDMFYSSSSILLSKGVQQLVWSLGGTATLSKYLVEGYRDSYRVRLCLPVSMSPTLAKEECVVNSSKPYKVLSSIEEVGEEEVACLLVDNESHLYITEGYIVTHNTSLSQYNSAEKEADVITYIFYDEEEVATSEPKVGMIKSRWGEVRTNPVSLFIHPECRRIYDMSSGISTSDVSNDPSNDVEI